MNILFLTMSKMLSVEQRGIYTDLMRKFRNEGHMVYIVSPTERRDGRETCVIKEDGVHILSVRTLNVQKTNIIEKGIGQLSIELLYKRAIKRHFKNIGFDLILYSTPPITFPKVIEYVKKANPSAKTYLLLKDIFPQNAVDMGMLSKTGFKGLLYKFFRAKEKKLYALTDHIGCMSPANVKYVLEHNPEINPGIVEIAPNSYAVSHNTSDGIDAASVRSKYALPLDKPIFIYGGNMGKPQGIPFLIDCINAVKDREDCHFVIVGNGTEYSLLQSWVEENDPSAVSLYKHIPKADYDRLARSCDVGLIFLDYRFTIPNYPSRLLPYLMEKKPIIAATDPNCDLGYIAEENCYGYWCPSNSVEAFVEVVNKMLASDRITMGQNGYDFYLNNYTIDHTYNVIISHFK